MDIKLTVQKDRFVIDGSLRILDDKLKDLLVNDDLFRVRIIRLLEVIKKPIDADIFEDRLEFVNIFSEEGHTISATTTKFRVREVTIKHISIEFGFPINPSRLIIETDKYNEATLQSILNKQEKSRFLTALYYEIASRFDLL